VQPLSKSSAKLCPCNKSGCPTIEKDGESIKITDDYGDSVIMTVEEAKEIADAIAYLETV
jgi:formylmethanofuran dehydrogenase subunit D